MTGRRDLAFVEGCDGWENCSANGSERQAGKGRYVLIALGSNAHIFARAHRCGELAECLRRSSAPWYGPLSSWASTGRCSFDSFPGGGHVSIEFTGDAPDDVQPRLGAWLELCTDDPAAVFQAALEAGLAEVRYPGHPYYFMIPGGQVFTIASTS